MQCVLQDLNVQVNTLSSKGKTQLQIINREQLRKVEQLDTEHMSLPIWINVTLYRNHAIHNHGTHIYIYVNINGLF